MSSGAERLDLIERVLIEHPKIKKDGDLMCRCGHVYRLGESVRRHPAAAVSAALALQDMGADLERAVALAPALMDLLGLRRLSAP